MHQRNGRLLSLLSDMRPDNAHADLLARAAGLSAVLPQVPTLADFSSGDALPMTASSAAAASSARPNPRIRLSVSRGEGPAITITPVAGSPARRTGAAIALIPGAYAS